MNNLFDGFTNLYPVSKTLKFELIPQGETLENMQKFIASDEDRKESYNKMKVILDDYHRWFLSSALENISLSGLEEYRELFFQKESQEALSKKGLELIKQLTNQITSSNLYKDIFKEKVIDELLTFVNGDLEKEETIKKFKKFFTYLTGYNENRNNIYSNEGKVGSVGYRTIIENLPTFIKNERNFSIIQSSLSKENIDAINKLSNEIFSNEITNIFSINFFNNVVSQNGIDKYNYLIGGYTLEDGTKVKGINEYINLFNQTTKEKKLPLLVILYKQILTEKTTISFLDEDLLDDTEVKETINQLYETYNHLFTSQQFVDFVGQLGTYDDKGIYLKNGEVLTTLSNDMYGNWNIIIDSVKKLCDDNTTAKNKNDSYYEKLNNRIKNEKSFSVDYINSALTNSNIEVISLQEHFKKTMNNYIESIKSIYLKLKESVLEKSSFNKGLRYDENAIDIIKLFLDECIKFTHLIKNFYAADSIENDNSFYNSLYYIMETIAPTSSVYNMVRNYITKKAYSDEKIKMNFECPTLLDGWDISKEQQNLCSIMMYDNKYFLSVVNSKKKIKNIFDSSIKDSNNCYYKKMVYNLLPGPNKMLPKVVFANLNKDLFNVPNEIIDINKSGTFKQGDNYRQSDMIKLIDFYKKSISKYDKWKVFDFKFSPSESYKNIGEFYREIESQGYKIDFINVSKSYIDNLVKEGNIFLFQIYNKDFSSFSKGKKNLHTMYWEALFDDANLKNLMYKLNGEAEAFYRKKSIKDEERIIHNANEELKNKNELRVKETSKFSYNLIKDRRYTVDKMFFHVPIKTCPNSINEKRLNDKVIASICKNNNINIIGIDRGERNLLYLSIINCKGEILEQKTLNIITNEIKSKNDLLSIRTDYKQKLKYKSDCRDKAKTDWKSIDSIKELKSGYISQIVHEICKLMIKYNAIVVMENLNSGFKNSRKMIDSQIYQKFEKALIEKLNFLVLKDNKSDEMGGIFKPYQLTNVIDSIDKIGSQTGFIFYVDPWLTSKIDPITGFFDQFYSNSKPTNIDSYIEFFNTFDSISYVANEDMFRFDFDYSKFNISNYSKITKWEAYSYGNRVVTYRDKEKNNNWTSKEVDITVELKNLFNEYHIDINENLKLQISLVNKKPFYESLYSLFKLVIQLRNSITDSDIDYIISPVKFNNEFFDSRKNNINLPIDADANGAFNIARKGLLLVNLIKTNPDDKKSRYVKREDWISYVQSKE